MAGLHHLHLKKHLYKSIEGSPRREALKRMLDKAMVFIALLGPAATLPQVYQVFATQDVEGLSLATWFAWTLLSGIWLVYGLAHKEMPIAISNAIYVVLQGVVVVAILAYGG